MIINAISMVCEPPPLSHEFWGEVASYNHC